MLVRRRFFFILIFFIFSPPDLAKAIKPSPPVQLIFQQQDFSKDETRITLSAKVNVDTEWLTLVIDLPFDVFVIGGEKNWEGPLQAGSTHNIELVIENSGGFQSLIEGKASIRLSNGVVFVQKRRFILNQALEKKPRPLPPIKRKGNQDSVIEFRGE